MPVSRSSTHRRSPYVVPAMLRPSTASMFRRPPPTVHDLPHHLDQGGAERRAGRPAGRGQAEHQRGVDRRRSLGDVQGALVERAPRAVPVRDAAVVAEQPAALRERRHHRLVVGEAGRVRPDRAQDAAAGDRRRERREGGVGPDRLRPPVADRLLPAQGVPAGAEPVGVEDAVQLGARGPRLRRQRAGRVEQQALQRDRLTDVGEVPRAHGPTQAAQTERRTRWPPGPAGRPAPRWGAEAGHRGAVRLEHELLEVPRRRRVRRRSTGTRASSA